MFRGWRKKSANVRLMRTTCWPVGSGLLKIWAPFPLCFAHPICTLGIVDLCRRGLKINLKIINFGLPQIFQGFLCDVAFGTRNVQVDATRVILCVSCEILHILQKYDTSQNGPGAQKKMMGPTATKRDRPKRGS